MQLEARLVIVHLTGQALTFVPEAVQDEELGDKVEEDERASARTEGHMRTSWLELEASAHRPLNVVNLLLIELVMSFFLRL